MDNPEKLGKQDEEKQSKNTTQYGLNTTTHETNKNDDANKTYALK